MEHTLRITDDLFEKIQEHNITEEDIDEICLRALESSLNSKKRRKRKKTYMIDDREFTIKKVDKDGHCFFSVIAIYTNESVEDIREGISDFMLRNTDEFINCYEEDEHEGDSYEKFIENIRSTNEWGDHLVIQATQMMLDRPIKIYEKDISNKLIQRPGATDDNATNDPIYMIYNGENHYDALIQKSKIKKSSTEYENISKKNVKEMVNETILIIEDEHKIKDKELKKLTISKLKDLMNEKDIPYKSKDKKSVLIEKILEFE